MLNVLIRAVFGTKHERDAKRMQPTVDAIKVAEWPRLSYRTLHLYGTEA